MCLTILSYTLGLVINLSNLSMKVILCFVSATSRNTLLLSDSVSRKHIIFKIRRKGALAVA